jgi:hypothetical protein
MGQCSLQEEEAAMQVFLHAKTPALPLLPLENSGWLMPT